MSLFGFPFLDMIPEEGKGWMLYSAASGVHFGVSFYPGEQIFDDDRGFVLG